MNKTYTLLFLLLFYPSIFHRDFLAAQSAWQYENTVRNYAYNAIDHPPVPGCTLFVGSSSFALWGKKLEETFADYEAVNRGFGGSRFPDNLRAIERIHLPADPSRVVIFCGTNDIAGGADAETVFNNFKFYIARIWNEFPATEIYFVCPTHAPVREKHWKTGDELFAKVQALAEKIGGLYCIDIRPGMLGEEGKVREDLFVKDRLHLNPDGYAIWEKVFKETFDAKAKDRKAPNLAELYQSRKSAGIFDDPRFAEQGIAIKDYSKPVKKLYVVCVGDDFTKGPQYMAGKNRYSPLPHMVKYLDDNGYYSVAVDGGTDGVTTADLKPKEALLAKIKPLADEKKVDQEYQLVFSLMLGMNDSKIGKTIDAVVYRNNLKAVIDNLLAEYPKSKVVIHRPAGHAPLVAVSTAKILDEDIRIRSYFAEIETLVNYYAQTSAKDQVFFGDVDAFNYFLMPPDVMISAEKQADILGRFWGAAILRAVQ